MARERGDDPAGVLGLAGRDPPRRPLGSAVRRCGCHRRPMSQRIYALARDHFRMLDSVIDDSYISCVWTAANRPWSAAAMERIREQTSGRSAGPAELLADRAYAELRDRIVTLRIAPGAPIDEDALGGELEIGRTPVREAIKRLALENLVTVFPRRGTFASEINITDLAHISDVRDPARRARRLPRGAADHRRPARGARRSCSRSWRAARAATTSRR